MERVRESIADDLPAVIDREAFVRDGGTGDGVAQAFEGVPLMGNEHTDGPRDPGRREFLGKAVAGIGAAGALTAGLGFANGAYAAETPTTIQVQSLVFPALGEAWYRFHRGGTALDYSARPSNEAVASCIMRIGHCTLPGPKIDSKSEFISPDTHFLIRKMGHMVSSEHAEENIKPQNPALYSFIEGLRAYWKGTDGRVNRFILSRAEQYFSNGIFYAVGLTQEDTSGTGLSYNDSLSPEGNAEILAEQFRGMTPHSDRLPVMRRLVDKSNAMAKSANRRNLSPDEPYYQILTTNWCAFMLVTTMQWDQNRRNEYLFINKNLEVPLREGIGYKIRDRDLLRS